MASFSYYGSVLSSSELLEKNLLCVTDADQEHRVQHRLEDGLCYCIPFASSDYDTLLISSLGEAARRCPHMMFLSLDSHISHVNQALKVVLCCSISTNLV